MTYGTCLFCLRALNGRSTKFCMTCLPPHGKWDDKRGYMRRYNELLAMTGGHPRWGFPSCKLPTPPALPLQPKIGPPAPRFCECGNVVFRRRRCDECLEYDRQLRLVREAFKLFPILAPNIRTSFRRYDLQPRPRNFPAAYPRAGGGSDEAQCRACLAPIARKGRAFSYSYCQTCAAQLRRFYKSRRPGPEYVDRPCDHCGRPWAPCIGDRRRYCSDECASERQTLQRRLTRSRSQRHLRSGAVSVLAPCEECGVPCRPRSHERDQTLCRRCRFIKKGIQRNAAQARRYAAESAGDDITWRELGERDHWQCHICLGRVLKRAGRAKEPLGATVDHLLPIADGGSHTWDNVALAHRSCNSQRGAGGVAQLRLTG